RAPRRPLEHHRCSSDWHGRAWARDRGRPGDPWNTTGVPATGTVARGHAIEGAPATPGTPQVFQRLARSRVGTRSRAPRRPLEHRRCSSDWHGRAWARDRGRLGDPWNTAGVPATGTVARGHAIEGA